MNTGEYANALSNTEAALYLSKYNLTAVADYVCTQNSSAFLPYHNIHHALNMVKWICRFNAMAPDVDALPYLEMRVLLIAALFHDFDHSGGRKEDSDNIRIARHAFQVFISKNIEIDVQLTIDEIEVVDSLIAVTQFPFIHRPKTRSAKLIRDADLFGSFEVHCVDILKGLKQEVELKNRTGIATEAFIEAQKQFLGKAEFYTVEAQTMHNALFPVFAKYFEDNFK